MITLKSEESMSESFSNSELKTVYDAVRYYQSNVVGPFKKDRYDECDALLQKLATKVNRYGTYRATD